jgi:hypothetical protein
VFCLLAPLSVSPSSGSWQSRAQDILARQSLWADLSMSGQKLARVCSMHLKSETQPSSQYRQADSALSSLLFGIRIVAAPS